LTKALAIPISKRKSAPTFTAKDNFRPRKGLVANPLCGFASGNPAGVTYGNTEELQRKARFFARKLFCDFAAKNAPKPNDENTKQRLLPAAYAKRFFRTLRHGVKFASGMLTRSV
jgi:hypothetical protein